MTVSDDTANATWYTEDGDAAYLGTQLHHRDMELRLYDKAPFGMVLFMWLRSAFLSILAAGFGALVGIVTGGGSQITVYAAVAGVGVFVLVFFFSKYNQPIAEWRVLLTARSHCADWVYSKIKGVIDERHLPMRVKARRMVNDTQTMTFTSRLIITDGAYTVFVSVFPYGSSLYLGWSMWRRRSGWSLFKRFTADAVASLFGVSSLLHVMLRADRPRAMREAVHSACREGLKVAVSQIAVPVGYGFAEGLPKVEQYTQVAMPNPTIPAPQPQPAPQFQPQPQPIRPPGDQGHGDQDAVSPLR